MRGLCEGSYVVEELAVLGGPSNLHDPRGDDRDLVVPDTRVHAECAADALEGGGITASLSVKGEAE